MHCRDLMTAPVFACRDDETVDRCAQLMRDVGIGFVPIVDAESKVVGVVTDRDLAVRVLADSKPAATRVGEVMSTEIVSCNSDEYLDVAEQRMVNAAVSRIVVLAAYGRLEGVISLSDIARVEYGDRATRVLRQIAAREASPVARFR